MKRVISVIISLVLIISVSGASFAAQAASLSQVKEVAVSAKTTSSVSLQWKKVSKANGYQIYCSTSKSKNYKKVKTVKSGKTVTAKVTGLKANQTYYFKVRAYNANSTGSFSAVVSAKTKAAWGTISGVKINPYAVTGRGEDGFGFACFTVKFTAVKDADGYQAKYYWEGDESNPTYKKFKRNAFYFGTQDMLPICKVRAYKKQKDGKTKYGPWKTIKWSDDMDFAGHIYEDKFDKKIGNQYDCIDD